MSLKRRVIHPQETYRFSTTHTLSDYPLLIGEILRRDELRALQQAKRRTLLYGLGKALGMRVARELGNPVIYYSGDPADRVEEYKKEPGARIQESGGAGTAAR